ncbi:putative zinc metalloproteinase [Pseudocercospora fuligena]|uniref:Putative zinc metalloproteinase n=1 Tax=Pseudocercospora fuligena TaxID=685502 RepID=A0A8H6RMP2_9PEZI|nr:putative zinc metalloproteinase [Pseudocercospora fuligena]
MVAKRSSDSALAAPAPKASRRIQPERTSMAEFMVDNLADGEVVHQACLLVTGTCPEFANSSNDYVSVGCQDSMGSHSQLNFSVAHGKWKSLVLLQSGMNELEFKLHHTGGVTFTSYLKVNYQPLLQVPPLHLAIMVAKDSPLVIDCPPAKYGAHSSAHSSLDAAIAKLRTTALMWQALTAEDMRQKGLGRRSFRLEEEWTATTLSLSGIASKGAQSVQMASVPKVHIIRTNNTVDMLRDQNIAQQNSRGHRREHLHKIFTDALKAHGGPFDSSCRPVVAGLILDSHYDIEHDLILGHAALGCHNANGISLGMFGSHTTYSWPRSMDEITSCLKDPSIPGDAVGNDNNECNTMAEACFVGQGAFLHEVGHAFGADHTTGIMARGYSKSWGHAFLPNNAPDHEAKWDLQDALRFKCKPHFRFPGDEPITAAFLDAGITIEVDSAEDGENTLRICSSAGLALVKITERDSTENIVLMGRPLNGVTSEYRITVPDRTDRFLPLEISALALNGKQKLVKDARKLFASSSYISIPGTSIRLRKQSIRSAYMDTEHYNPDDYIEWSVLLRRYSSKGKIVRATSIDLRVGCTFDGAVIYYADGTHANCGPPPPYCIDGGHASESHPLPKNSRITKVELGREWRMGRS